MERLLLPSIDILNTDHILDLVCPFLRCCRHLLLLSLSRVRLRLQQLEQRILQLGRFEVVLVQVHVDRRLTVHFVVRLNGLLAEFANRSRFLISALLLRRQLLQRVINRSSLFRIGRCGLVPAFLVQLFEVDEIACLRVVEPFLVAIVVFILQILHVFEDVTLRNQLLVKVLVGLCAHQIVGFVLLMMLELIVVKLLLPLDLLNLVRHHLDLVSDQLRRWSL